MIQKILALTLSLTLAVGSLTAFSATAQASSATVSPFTSETYTHADAFDSLNIYNGIDVSRYQGDIDWEKAKSDGVEYAIIRAGYRGSSLGTLTTDPKYEENVAGAIAAGIKVGLYFYTEAVNTTEAKEEANYVISLAQNYDISLPIAYDIEYTNASGRMVRANLSKSEATKNCRAFCKTIESAGYTAMVYANRTFLTTNINGASLAKTYKIWLANYTTSTPYTGTYEYWQYSSSGTVSGISGKVDCNFWYTSSSIDSLNATSIAKAKFSTIPNKKYTGNAITPTPSLKLNGTKLKAGVDYRLVYSNNKKIGKATVKAKGIGKYKGSVSTTFQIVPKKVTSFKRKAGTKQITLTWAADSNATGYQIFRKSTYNGKTYTKIKNITKNTRISYTDTKLKSNREYFYCIRSYTKVDGKKYYSDYTYLTAPTLPGTQKTTLKKKATLYKEPTAKDTVLVKIPKNTTITYLGRTYTKKKNYSLHIKCTIDGKTYKGYLSSKTTLSL